MNSIEEQFDREKMGQGSRAFDDLLPEERAEVTKAFAYMTDHSGGGHAKAIQVILGLMHKTYAQPTLESRIGTDPAQAHALHEADLARCGAVNEMISLLTDQDTLISVLENLQAPEKE